MGKYQKKDVLNAARAEIWQSWRRACVDNIDHPRAKEIFNRHKLPAFHDPFAGGGALPLEAQRLGMDSYATDLNPVAVLINKAMIEIPPKFAGLPPMNPAARKDPDLIARQWKGAEGLAEDVRYYGQWIRDEAEKRIGHLYPKIEITPDMATKRPDLQKLVGHKLTVIAWLWARTVKSPNPAYPNVDVPLVSSFVLSPMAGKEAYVVPVVNGGSYSFTVEIEKPADFESIKNGTKLSRGANFRCIMTGTPIVSDYIKSEGRAGRMGSRLMAIVAEGDRTRVYLPPNPEMESIALTAVPAWQPETPLAPDLRALWTPLYGLTKYGDLFTPRQLVALVTFCDLIADARERIVIDANESSLSRHNERLSESGVGSEAYADAISVYLAFLVSKLADKGSSLCTWDSGPPSNRTASGRSARVATVRVTFGRQALPMSWDYAEVNFFSDSVGSIETVLKTLTVPLDYFPTGGGHGEATSFDAQSQTISIDKVVSTDPPYYDNIGYADLSDFFYVWLRRSLRNVFPKLFSTLAVPKMEELVAVPYRHGSKYSAEAFFLEGMTEAMRQIAKQSHPAFPTTIYYAYKQSEADEEDGTKNTGWDVFLEAVIEAGFSITGTWPIRTELANRMIGTGTNALASSVVLVCRLASADAPVATRREFLTALRAELPVALAYLQKGNIAPVDLAQASIGPGMAVYTRYARVLDAEGKILRVHDAQTLINQMLDEVLSEQEGDFDSDTRWAVTWFDEYGFSEGDFGKAEVLARAKVTAVSGLVEAHIVASKSGKVRLLKPSELDKNWNPRTDERLTVWEIVHHLIRVLENGGEAVAASLLSKIGMQAEVARELAYRLYIVCERKKRNNEALSYNALVQSWPEINRLAQLQPAQPTSAQADMFQGV